MKLSEMSRGRVLNDRKLLDRVANILDIQADGGDSPGSVIKWAFDEAHREVTAENLRERAARLEASDE